MRQRATFTLGHLLYPHKDKTKCVFPREVWSLACQTSPQKKSDFEKRRPGQCILQSTIVFKIVFHARWAYIYGRAHKLSDTQTQTLTGIHRRASHKPPHDVRWQLCAPSRPFSAQPSGNVGSHNPRWYSKQQLETRREGELSCSLSCHTFPSLEYELLYGAKKCHSSFSFHDTQLRFIFAWPSRKL